MRSEYYNLYAARLETIFYDCSNHAFFATSTLFRFRDINREKKLYIMISECDYFIRFHPVGSFSSKSLNSSYFHV